MQQIFEYLPAFEFWVTAQTFIGGVTFLFATGLAIIGLRNVAGKSVLKASVWALVFLTGTQWWSSARQEELRTKPERDYAYIDVDPDYSEVVDGRVTLSRRSTGILDGVVICFSRTSEYSDGKYVTCSPPMNFDQGGRLFIRLPLDDYTIDSDAMTKLGKIRERLDIVQNNGRAVIVAMSIQRKESGELICESPKRPGIKPCL